MHGYHRATNGIGVQFRSRYKTNSFYNVFFPGHERDPIEIRHSDNGELAAHYGEELTPAIVQAFGEYQEQVQQRYEQWRKDNASLFDNV